MRKAFVVVIAAALILPSGLSVPAWGQDPSLTAVNVTFKLPKCDNRNPDTRIEMSVVKAGTVIAEDTNMAPGREFDDPGTYGPFPLVLKNAVTKTFYAGSTTKLHITPHGNDTWCTEIHVEALFADNSRINTWSCTVVKVSERNRDAQFVNQPC